MTTALIGHTGFVGSNLARQRDYDAHFNSKNIETAAGQSFDRVVCAGMPGAKWYADLNPQEDYAALVKLTDALHQIEAKEFVLISTVDVYVPSIAKDESDPATAEPPNWYGWNRRKLEDTVRGLFPNALIIRLPALFGDGLKKNALYDLMHNNQPERIPRNAVYQWYKLKWVSDDIEDFMALGIKLVNLVSDPIAIVDVAALVSSNPILGEPLSGAPDYAIGSRYSKLSSREMMRQMAEFIKGAA